MIVGKGSKTMYTLLKKVYGIIDKGYDNTIIYVSEDYELMYQASFVSGKMKITKNKVTILEGAVEKNRFYELSKLPRNRFDLKPIGLEKVTENMEMALSILKNTFTGGYFVCELSACEHQLISKVTRLTERYINDSYMSMMRKFGECEVWHKGSCIILKKNELVEKEALNVEEEMCFYCETYKSVDENIQGKMQFDEYERLGGMA